MNMNDFSETGGSGFAMSVLVPCVCNLGAEL
jgi:hypothetical protein